MSAYHIPYQWEISILIIRLMAGILFLFQGYDKLFRIKVKGVYRTFSEPMAKKGMPDWILRVSAYYTTYAEFFGGLLLVLGLFVPWVTLLLVLDLLLVAIAFGILEPMWDMKHVFPRFILLIALWWIPAQTDLFSLDYLLIHKP